MLEPTLRYSGLVGEQLRLDGLSGDAVPRRRACDSYTRSILNLQQHAGLRGDPGNLRHHQMVAAAKNRHRHVELIESRRNETGESYWRGNSAYGDGYRVGHWIGAGKYETGRDRGIGRSKPSAIKLEDVAGPGRLRGAGCRRAQLP